jgi:putative transposase
MRAHRKLREGATYHVTSEINRGNKDLKDREIKAMFLETVEKAKSTFVFVICNFCIMDNHIHFLITPGSGQSLSKIMQYIKCNSAKAWNKKHQTKGHLWGDRFFSRIITSVEDFLRVFEYIDQNPVKAGLVKEARHWEFGGFFHRLHRLFKIITDPDEWTFEGVPIHVPVTD